MISCLVHTYNSQRYIEWCLKSLTFCDEIVIVDMYSTDRTIEIARRFTDKIFFHDYVGYVEPARAFGVSKCTYNWILIIDSDEIVPPNLSKSLRKLAMLDKYDVVLIARRNFIFGKEIIGGGWGFYQDLQPRFFKKNFVTFSDKIHSGYMISSCARIGKINSLEEAIIHFNYDSISQFFRKLDVYTDFEIASNRINVKEQSSLVMLYKFLKAFLGRYFLRKGYKDGVYGLYLALLMGIYKATVYAKSIMPSENECFKIYKQIFTSILEEDKNKFTDL